MVTFHQLVYLRMINSQGVAAETSVKGRQFLATLDRLKACLHLSLGFFELLEEMDPCSIP